MDNPRRVALVIGVVTLVGAALRLVGLGQEALWSDEYYSWMSASAPSVGEMLDRLAKWDSQPPLYFLVLHAWIRAGFDSDAMLRLPGALLSAASVPAFACAALRLFPDRPAPALAAGILYAISPFQVWYAQEVRPYGMLAAWEAFALWGGVALVADPGAPGPVAVRRAVFVAAGLLGGAITHFHGWFVGFGIGMPLLVAAVRDARLRRPAALALGVPLVGVVASAGRVAGLVREGPNIGWLPPFSLRHLDDMVVAQAVGPLFCPLPVAGWWIAVVLACCLGGAGIWAVSRRGGTPAACIGWGVAGTVALPLAVTLLVRPVLFMGQRYEIIAQPFAILLLAGALDLPVAVARRAAGIGLGVLAMAQCWWLADYHRDRQKHPWDIAAREVAARVEPGTPVRVLPSRLAGLLERYAPDGLRIEGIERADVQDAAGQPPVAFVALGDIGDELLAAGIGPDRVSIGLVEASRPGQEIHVLIVRTSPQR